MASELAVAPINSMELLQSAVEKGAGIEVIERLVALQREMREYEAKVEFDKSMHRTQSKMKRIGADATNPQTRSKYATYAALDRALRPLYTEDGFSLSFNNGECPIPDYVRVICYVSREGHTRTYQIDMPADGKGAKGGDVMTKTHAVGAAESYGMRYLLKMIFNVAVSENDDDGNGGLKMSERDVYENITALEFSSCQADLTKNFAIAHREATEANDMVALKQFMAAKDRRKRELKEMDESS